MTDTAARVFEALDRTYPTQHDAARALGITRQAYSLARQRQSLSDAVCIRACLLTGLDPADTLIRLQIDAATTPETIAVWEGISERLARHPEARPVSTTEGHQQPHQQPDTQAATDNPDVLYYVKSPTNANHFMYPFRTKRIEQAERLCQWMLCVPKISPASPRFAYYADNWNVIEKIHRFTASGEYDSIVKDCPAFSSEELRAALDYLNHSNMTEQPCNTSEPLNRRQNTPRYLIARSIYFVANTQH